MRQLFLSIAILLCSSSLAASWQIGVDAMCIDSAFAGALRLDAEASYCWDELRLTVPIRYSRSFEHELDFIEAEIAVSVYPIDGCGVTHRDMERAGAFHSRLVCPLLIQHPRLSHAVCILLSFLAIMC